MPNPALDTEALSAKSKVFIGRAISSKSLGSIDEYQLWASLALELLGKAALARVHPCLVADPTSSESLFVAAGVSITTDIKTITAKTVFDRLKKIVPRFDSRIETFCLDISKRRNAELHSGELPFFAMRLEAWESRYWHASDTILQYMNLSLEHWLGAADALAPRQLLDEAKAALKAAVRHRVEAAEAAFQKLASKERKLLIGRSELISPQQHAAVFGAAFDATWKVSCPACDSAGIMAGRQVDEVIIETTTDTDSGRWDPAIWETVRRQFDGEEFACLVCDLRLSGSAQIEAADLDASHEDEDEREMEYEEDYGND